MNALNWNDRGMIRRKSATIGRSFAGSVSGYLPSTITEMWEPQRDFAFLKLPVSGVRTIVAMSRSVLSLGLVVERWSRSCSTIPQIMVVTSEGSFHVYSIDLEAGGECVLQKTFRSVPFASFAKILLTGIDDRQSHGGNRGQHDEWMRWQCRSFCTLTW